MDAGPEMDAEVARVIFGHTEGIGYYGPPVDPNEPWAHEKSVRYDTYDEAKAAYAAYVAGRVALGHSQRGRATVDEMDFTLCYWQHGWGPLSICNYSTWIAAAWKVIEKMRARGYSTRIAICGHECNGKEFTVEFFDENDGRQWRASEATMPLAICRAALSVVRGAK